MAEHISGHQQPPNVSAEEYLSTSQLARRLNTSEGHLKSLRKKGLGPPFVKFSDKCVRYPLAGVDKWIAAQESATEKGTAE